MECKITGQAMEPRKDGRKGRQRLYVNDTAQTLAQSMLRVEDTVEKLAEDGGFSVEAGQALVARMMRLVSLVSKCSG